ncbi:sodium/glutamate symporter [Neobacillus kokaensis]|uniref:Sodium:glutamate symporter n=1 Tax=Neobacillus kokaensis TaxID=2759023 RepID=A0ABQ3N5U5_9BACI|nr:sodium/glutamate symporter [Neobacillus kokaensis]GHH99373.1 sodium:glutamate symporter [Neobacillus kokaensis]
MELLIGFGWLSFMLVIGIILRYKVSFFQNMLIPSSAIGGVIGFILINTGVIQVSIPLLQTFVSQLFIISFISIGLTTSEGSNGLNSSNRTSKVVTKGVLWFALAWGLMVNLQALIGIVSINGINLFGHSLDPKYGILLPFGFAMGTGQAITYGTVAEDYGFSNAASIAITFAVVGYMIATFVGIPLARWGIRKGIASKSEKLSEELLKGVLPKEKRERVGDLTFHSSNIETLTFHLAVIGVVYLVAYYSLNGLIQILPPKIATFVGGSLFIFGILWGTIFSKTAKIARIDHFFSPGLQKSITGWTVDFMVVASFMSVSFRSIQGYVLPIIIITLIGGIVTTVVCFYLGQRVGSNYDFERSISFYGLVTGQVPNSLLLLRIVDPRFSTPPILEIAIYNSLLPVTLLQIFLGFAPIIWEWSVGRSVLFYTGSIVIYMILLKVCKLWGPKTFSMMGSSESKPLSDQPVPRN